MEIRTDIDGSDWKRRGVPFMGRCSADRFDSDDRRDRTCPVLASRRIGLTATLVGAGSFVGGTVGDRSRRLGDGGWLGAGFSRDDDSGLS